ncbi:zinc finger, CCHC-type containing protein [Tanacetum coccineum]
MANTAMSVVYVLTTPIPKDGGDDLTVKQIRKRNKWDNDDYVYRGLILKEAKYLAEDASSKKFLVSNFINYKMTDSRLIMEQYNELLGILGRFTQHKMNMDEAIQVSCIIDKLFPSWKDFKHTLKHKKEELTLVELGSHLRIEESLKVQDNEKPKGSNVAGPVPNKRKMITPYELWTKRKPNLNYLKVWGCRVVVRLPDPKLKTLGERGIECIFDAIFDGNKFSSVPIPSLGIPNGTEDIGDLVVPEEVVQQPEPKLRKSKRNRTPKDFGLEFKLYLIKGTRDEGVAFWKEAINDGMESIMGNNTWVLADLPPGCKPLGYKWIFKRKLKMDVKTSFLNGDLDEEVYMNQPQGFIMPGNENKMCKLIKSLYGLKQTPKQWHQKFDEVVLSNGYLLNQADKCVYSKFDKTGKGVIICIYVDDMLIFSTDQVQVDLTKEFLSSKFSMRDMGEADVIHGIWIKHERNGIAISQSYYIEKAISQLMYSRVIGYFMYAMIYTRPDIAFVVGKLTRYTTDLGTQHWQAIQRASKKQTCITGSTMESKFVALAAAGKEAEWLKNLLLEILLWSNRIAHISICCDSALAKAYSQMYNGKSRHLGVRHSMIRELITNGDETCIKSAKGMGLKFNIVDKMLGHTNPYKGNLLAEFNWKSNFQRTECHMYLHIILSVLGTSKKKDKSLLLNWSMDFGSYNIYELDMDTWLV